LSPVTFSAQAVPPPVITAIAPDTLRPGQAATLTGSNFSALAADNVVRVNNTVAILRTVSPNQVTFTVPCETTGIAQVSLATNGATVEGAHPLSGGAPLTLGVGQAISLGPNELGCNELSADGSRYLIAVVHNVPTGNATTSIRLRGASTSAAPPAMTTTAAADVRTAPSMAARTAAARAVPGLRDQARHMRLLEEGARLIGRLPRTERALRQASPNALSAQSLAQTIAVGDTVSLRIPDIDAGNLCTVKST